MEVIYHLGVHATDEDQIANCLLRNAEQLNENGIKIPEPVKCREVLADAKFRLSSGETTSDIQRTTIEALGIDLEKTECLILSDPSFMGQSNQAIGDDALYPKLEENLSHLASIFGAHGTEFCIGLCNPAVFIPEVLKHSGGGDLQTFLNRSDPAQLRWSETLTRLKACAPGCKITVWANEDTPFTWREVLHAVSRQESGFIFEGMEEFYANFIAPRGIRRMKRRLRIHRPETDEAYKILVESFIRRFGQENLVETEINLPGWNTAYVDALSAQYDEDLAVVANMPGIRFINP
ncbi:MAG: hypothetical protein ABJ327_01930 [Litoreibacter sp.]